MSQSELLKKVILFLESTGVPYMVTGSHASSVQGAPRSTHDIDVLVRLRFGDCPRILEAFPPPEFFVDRDAIIDALKSDGQFNIMENASGDKIDFWMLTDSAFDAARFSRKAATRYADFDMNISSPEDTILMKLKWAMDAGGSEKQFKDALNVFEVQQHRLDRDYLDTWAVKLGVSHLLADIRKQSTPD